MVTEYNSGEHFKDRLKKDVFFSLEAAENNWRLVC